MRSLAYSHLVKTEFNPGVGIILRFVSYRLTIEGRNLVRLYNDLEDGAVGEIVEQHANEMSVAEDDAYISKIVWESL